MQTNATSHQIEFVNEKRILIWDFMSGCDRDELTEQRIVGSETFEESLKVRQVDVGLDSFNVFYGADYQKGICEVSKHLCHIFPGPIELHTSVAFGNFTEIFSYPHLHHLDRIHIAGSILLKKTLEQIFGKTTVKTEISIDPDTDDEYPIMQVCGVLG
uniref:FBA_2 domain-containing protein n=1 Tax=Caenorhabditis tropicalis TaxID=1561998 RepID=A0A1I7URG3_9PELO